MRTVLIIGPAVLIALNLIFVFDYQDLSWEANKGAYLNITAMAVLLIGNLLANRRDQTQNPKH